MNSLFEERSKALRRAIFELMNQKQTEMEMLREELEPQKELLRQKHKQGLITEGEMKDALQKLLDEENERTTDIEIEFSDKEKALQDELEVLRLEAEAE